MRSFCPLFSALRSLPDILHFAALRKRMTGRKTSCHTCAASEESICCCVVAGITGRSARANYSKRSMRTKSSKRAGDGETAVFKSFRISGQIKKPCCYIVVLIELPELLEQPHLQTVPTYPIPKRQRHKNNEAARKDDLVDYSIISAMHSTSVCMNTNTTEH